MKKYLGFVAVSLFLLSCTNTDRDNPYDMYADNYIGNVSAEGSSSSVEAGEPSSSSVVYSGGSVEPSSSSVPPSSSSGAGLLSSSSVAPSSSSAPPNSSSVVPSCSSVVLSSSSAPPSSSSLVPSSSSLDPNVTGTLAFKNTDYSNSGVYFFVGTNVTIEKNINSTIAVNNADAGCGEISIELSGCDAPGTVYTTTTNCTITAKAVATCKGTRRELKTATAEVVPDPYLNGSCAWDSKNNAFVSGAGAKVVTAPTIQNAYGRCEGPYFLVSGEQRQNVSVGLTVDEWSGNATQTMSGVTIGATCASKATATIACPVITVRDPNAILRDSRDNQSYQTVIIGTQTWMAENLNYETSDSKCYNNNSANCNIYGRLYNWSSAMGLPSSCNSSTCSSQIQTTHRGICPKDWHLPSDAEWTILKNYVGGSSTARTKLNDYGFSALLGGYGYSDGSFSTGGLSGYWWSATESNASSAYSQGISFSSNSMNRLDYGKSNLYSVRCVQD